jgi:hypothetical protein
MHNRVNPRGRCDIARSVFSAINRHLILHATPNQPGLRMSRVEEFAVPSCIGRYSIAMGSASQTRLSVSPDRTCLPRSSRRQIQSVANFNTSPAQVPPVVVTTTR